jgi:hypothetical protein
MGGDARCQQLVSAHAERIEHALVDLVELATGGEAHDLLVRASAPERAVGELGRECGVGGVQSRAIDLGRQQQIRIRIVGCRRPDHLEGHLSGRLNRSGAGLRAAAAILAVHEPSSTSSR